MNTEYAHTITKEEVEELPMEKFEGRIFVLTNEKDANRAVAYLERYPVLGFDTETRPNFRRGRRNKIALVQLSTEDTCFLFRLNRMGFPASLKKLLGNADVKKVGLSLRDDFGAIRKRTEIKPENFLDLQPYVGQFGIEASSLQKIYAIMFQKKISKGQRLSNWEAENLTEPQQRYAALDAWACLHIYKQLNNQTTDELS